MFRNALILATAVAVTLSATSGAFAGKKQGLVVFNEKGDAIFDDGKLDGRGCQIGKKAVFDKKTGEIKVVSRVKCNFDE
jgi:hypothetical protein